MYCTHPIQVNTFHSGAGHHYHPAHCILAAARAADHAQEGKHKKQWKDAAANYVTQPTHLSAQGQKKNTKAPTPAGGTNAEQI